MSTREERNARYVAFLGVDCGKERYSAGRVRCDDCHRVYVTPVEPGLTRRERG